jgi:hypothetical protein
MGTDLPTISAPLITARLGSGSGPPSVVIRCGRKVA